jgi:hypothetical protein
MEGAAKDASGGGAGVNVGLNVALDGDIVWRDVKKGVSHLQNYFRKKGPAKDHSETWEVPAELRGRFLEMAEAIEAEEGIAGYAILSEGVKPLGNTDKEFTWSAAPGYRFTKLVAVDMRKDGKNGTVDVELQPEKAAGRIRGLSNRATRWRLEVYAVQVSRE